MRQAPEVRRKFDEVLPSPSHAWEKWLPVRPAALSEVPGEDVGGVARYEGLVRVRYAMENGSRTVVFEGRERMRAVADHYVARFLEKGWTYRVLYASADEERHEFQLHGTRVVLRAQSVAGTVRIEITENTGLPTGALGRKPAQGRSP